MKRLPFLKGSEILIILFLTVLIGAILFLCFSYFSREKVIPFDQEGWNAWEDELGIYIPSERYEMTLWLEQHSDFCGKSKKEIFSFFGVGHLDGDELSFRVKQEEPFLFNMIDLPIDLAFLEVSFSGENVYQVWVRERENSEEEFVYTYLCE